MQPYADNVAIKLEPIPKQTESGIALAYDESKRKVRTGVVVASGRGYFTRLGAMVENQVRTGDRVVVDRLAGQKTKDYSIDLYKPRQNAGATYDTIGDERGEFRIVREDEILCVIDREARVE